jgi:hypothetical protein
LTSLIERDSDVGNESDPSRESREEEPEEIIGKSFENSEEGVENEDETEGEREERENEESGRWESDFCAEGGLRPCC